MKFKNCHKQLTISFKIYADFEHNVKNINVNISDKYSDICDNLHTPKNIKIRILSVLLLKLFVLMINLSNQLFLREEKMKFINLLMKFFKKVWLLQKKVLEKQFNKNLLMSTNDEERFQLSNKCWICDKLFDVRDDKIRDHCHVTGKYRGSAHWSCNVHLKLTENIPVMFHNLRGYDSHLIMQEINRFDVKVNVIPNGLEKYMALTINDSFYW